MYVEVSDVKKSYGEGGSYMQVLKGVSVGIEKGKMCVIQGTSGSGKSTLLNCIGGLDVVDSGSIQVDGQEMVGLKMDALSDYRRDYLGFIFQFYNLVPNLTVRENIQVCEYLRISRWIWMSFWRCLDSPSIRTNSHRSCPVDSSSVARLPVHSSRIRSFCSAMSQLEHWIQELPGISSFC